LGKEQDGMSTWRLGVNTCFAVKRWPEPLEWARIVREELNLDLAQLCLDLVDVHVPDEALKSQAADVRDACKEYDLQLDSTFTGLAAYSANVLLDPRREVRSRWEEWFRRVMTFTAWAGGRFTGGHVGAFTVSDWNRADVRQAGWRELKTTLARLAEHAKVAGLGGLYVEGMAVAREPSVMSQMEDLLAAGDESHAPIALCLDVGHQCVRGTDGQERDPYAWLERFRSRVGCLHVQQSDAEYDHHWPFTERFNSAGRIDPARILDVLGVSAPGEVKLFLEIISPFEEEDDQVLADLVQSARCWQTAIDGGSPGSEDSVRGAA
jgi:D-erythrulose 1-phosphate 3-epimerase